MSPRPAQSAGPPPDAPVFSVRQLNRDAKRLLEGAFPNIWVSGEISRFTHHGSGHMYFDLKDADASISCAMFRGSQRGLRFKPGQGQQVLVKAKVSIFEAGGRYQLIVEHMEEAGEGLLRRQFEELKLRLQTEGLFSDEHKQPLPALPMRIGVVTSPTGAAIRDILQILARRHPAAEVIIYPARVQGEGAREEVAAAIAIANKRAECDVLIVGRGGGSLEDLWTFNEEAVARAIFASALPVVSAVGHEIDFTISDLVADLRAPTPSGAAEIIAPDKASLIDGLRGIERRAGLALNRMLNAHKAELRQHNALLKRLHPEAVLAEMQQRCDELTSTLVNNLQFMLDSCGTKRAAAHQRLLVSAPAGRIAELNTGQRRLQRQLQRAMTIRLEQLKQRAASVAGNLNAVSPLATLERGYAIVRKTGSSKVLTHVQEFKTGDAVEVQLADGIVDATVTGTRSSDN